MLVADRRPCRRAGKAVFRACADGHGLVRFSNTLSPLFAFSLPRVCTPFASIMAPSVALVLGDPQEYLGTTRPKLGVICGTPKSSSLIKFFKRNPAKVANLGLDTFLGPQLTTAYCTFSKQGGQHDVIMCET